MKICVVLDDSCMLPSDIIAEITRGGHEKTGGETVIELTAKIDAVHTMCFQPVVDVIDGEEPSYAGGSPEARPTKPISEGLENMGSDSEVSQRTAAPFQGDIEKGDLDEYVAEKGARDKETDDVR
jgi:hypothetical protein